MRTFFLLTLFVATLASASDPGGPVYFDCANYCAFSEFQNNCHGIAFIQRKDNKINFDYGIWSNKKQGCVSPAFLSNKFVPNSEITSRCQCPGNPLPLPDLYEPMKESTARELRELREKIRAYVPCGPNPLTIPTPVNNQAPYKPEDVVSCKWQKENGIDGYLVMGDCNGDQWHWCGYFGNTNNYAGPLCYAGEMDRCRDVKLAQNPETGAWYRNAFGVRDISQDHGQPTFSRDEFLGVMLYLLKTRDKVAAEKWMRFIANNPKKRLLGKLYKVYNICPPLPAEKPSNVTDQEWAKMQPDDRCEMRGDSWAAMYKVYKAIGFTNAELKSISKGIFRKMRNNSWVSGITAELSVRGVNPHGYEQGNQASNILLLRGTGMSKNKLLDDAANVIDERSGYESAYYRWLATGGKATEYGAYLIKKYCPTKLPNYTNPPQGGIGTASASFFDYGVHWYGGLYGNWQAVLPNGHECIGWINLYLGSQ